jgi:hypothetical protein
MPYTKNLPPYGHVMTVPEFKQAVKEGAFIDYDGMGEAAKLLVDDSEYIYPSTVDKIPVDATHIIWYNK